MFKLIALLIVTGQAVLLAQGTLSFRTTIIGFELIGENRVAVRGGGNLTLSGNTLSYDISVPLRRYLPFATHFHGPAVDGENPIISLVPFEDFGGFIRYTGSQPLDFKWLPDLRAGHWYINVHGHDYENSILSGYVMPVPEPTTLGLIVLGLGMLAGRKLVIEQARRRR